MALPPGPRAPAAWQTIAWMARPATFLRAVHDRFGDPLVVVPDRGGEVLIG